MILCCDLPRGKFPYLVFNLVVFGHLVSSCVTQATLETRVLPFSCILQFAPDSASFVLSFALDVPSRSIPFPSSPTYPFSSPCRRNRPLLPESLQPALHKDRILHRAKLLPRRLSVNAKGIPADNQFLPSQARIMVKQVPQPPLLRFIRGVHRLHWLPKPSRVRSAELLPLCTIVLVGTVARIK